MESVDFERRAIVNSLDPEFTIIRCLPKLPFDVSYST